jgi:hypothetical protein
MATRPTIMSIASLHGLVGPTEYQPISESAEGSIALTKCDGRHVLAPTPHSQPVGS